MSTPTQKALILIIQVILTALLNALILMWLWNYLVPSVFNGPTLTFFQSIVLKGIADSIFGKLHARSTES